MSASKWPPSLKDFVGRALSSSSADNKTRVNEEMRKIIFAAYSSGQMGTIKWEDMDPFDVLETLKNQKLRTTATPAPPPTALPKQFGSTKGHHLTSTNGKPQTQTSPATGQKRKKGNPANTIAASTAPFPSAYTFATNNEDEARAKRARRFEREMELERERKQGGPSFLPRQINGHDDPHHRSALDVTDDVGVRKMTLGNLGVGVSAGGKRKWLGSRLGMDDLADPDPNVIDWDRHTIVGTNTRLEKSYLRLTSEPDPADIRPLPVLRQTLELLKRKWKQEENYAYICDQFKSLRQDLTVQRIKNEFTVLVYEIHARMALQVGDLGEYNQCQSMLKQLYERDIPGKPEEFLAYRILYLLHTQNKAELSRSIGHLTAEEKAQGPVKQALDISTAMATGNYHRFFKLYMEVANMGGYIVDQFVARERMAALTKMAKAYITLPLPYLVKELAFDDEAQCDEFLADHKAATYTNPTTTVAPTAATHKSSYAGAARRHLGLPTPTPLEARIWDCRAAYPACEAGNQRYRKVDIKGQL